MFTKGQEILESGAVNKLQIGGIIITQTGKYYKKRSLYYKVGQVLQNGQKLLKSGATITERANTSS